MTMELFKECAASLNEAARHKRKAATAEETATKRLLKYKDATAKINVLRDKLEATKDELSFSLTKLLKRFGT
jgi:hypothetical protein